MAECCLTPQIVHGHLHRVHKNPAHRIHGLHHPIPKTIIKEYACMLPGFVKSHKKSEAGDLIIETHANRSGNRPGNKLRIPSRVNNNINERFSATKSKL